MSYEEYNDLFIKAQQNDNAKYIAFVFDIKSSKLMDKRTRKSAQLKTFNTINLMIKYIKTLEVECKNKILINELPVLTTDNVTKPRNEMLSYLNNPCVVFGDSFAFYCYNNSIKTQDFIDIFIKSAKICNNNIKYHFSSGKFETLFYSEGNEKYYIGYIIEKLSKEKNRKENIL